MEGDYETWHEKHGSSIVTCPMSIVTLQHLQRSENDRQSVKRFAALLDQSAYTDICCG